MWGLVFALLGVTQVVLVKPAGIMSFELAAEEFAERCRVNVPTLRTDELKHSNALATADLVVTMGQAAYDEVRAAGKHLIIPLYAPLAENDSPTLRVDPVATAALFHRVVPARSRIGIVYGARADFTMTQLSAAAPKLGITLSAVRVSSPQDALKALFKMRKNIDAIYLLPDVDVVSPQVFQLALRLQLAMKLPILASTRQQVRGGALLSLDYEPRLVGRFAAREVNRLMRTEDLARDVYRPELTINKQTATRLDLDPDKFLHALKGAK